MNLNKLLKVSTLAGKILLESGAETYRVEETIVRICLAFGAQSAESFVIPTGIIVTITHNDEVSTLVRRITSRGVDLNKIDKINNLSRKVQNSSMSIDDFTFNYKSEYIWLYANTETKNNDGAYWLEYYVMDNYDEDPFVASDGSVSTYFTGTSHVTCYVIDAEGNVFSDNCTVTVRLTFLQWIIKYLCFGWLWGFNLNTTV